MRILVLHGPNLNCLGQREPEIYGSETLQDIEKSILEKVQEKGGTASFFQSNHEGALVEEIQKARGQYDAILINAGAYTHTSVAIHDALKIYDGTIIEIHLSNPMAREAFRHVSYIAPLAKASICGMGSLGYHYAIDYLFS